MKLTRKQKRLSLQDVEATSDQSPVLDPIDSLNPFPPMAVLVAICLLPVAAQLRRSWLATSIAGHMALAACAISMIGAS